MKNFLLPLLSWSVFCSSKVLPQPHVFKQFLEGWSLHFSLIGKPLSEKSKIQASMQNFSSKFLFRHFGQAKYKQKNCFAKCRWKRRNKVFLRKAFKKQVNLKDMFKNLKKFKAVWIFTNKRTDNCLFNEYFVMSHISFRRNQKKSLITLSPQVCAQTIFCWKILFVRQKLLFCSQTW